MSADVVFRPYTPRELEACLALIRSNTPEHFVPAEESEYARSLGALPGPYFVALGKAGRVIGAGGIGQEPEPETDVATLCWGLVHRESQGRGSRERCCGIASMRSCRFVPSYVASG